MTSGADIETESLFVERITVEEGFLEGLVLPFVPGLNVLVGPRGVGKTSVIELLRYALAVSNLSDRFEAASRGHARSVLNSGKVTVGARFGAERVDFERTSEDEATPTPLGTSLLLPIILSQNEIEALGIDATGRLRILDGFVSGLGRFYDEERSLAAEIRRMTAEANEARAQISELQTELAEGDQFSMELAEAEAEAVSRRVHLASVDPELRQLDEQSLELARVSARGDALTRSLERIADWRRRVNELAAETPELERWPNAAEPDALAAARSKLAGARSDLDGAVRSIEELEALLRSEVVQNAARRSALQEEAREVRRRVEEMVEGAGAAERRLTILRERAARINALSAVVVEKTGALERIIARRSELLDHLEFVRGRRYAARAAAAEQLNRELGPSISIEVVQSGLQAAYAGSLASALKGSGLQYGRLAPLIAGACTPRELGEAVEQGRATDIQQLVNLDPDRAARLVNHLTEYGVGEILTATVEDHVIFRLLDGPDYKPTPDLSTGQRCTVVLTIVMQHQERTLVLDQPEDHLDNAFVAQTFIPAISARNGNSQLIIATHNANIPVLGEADQVVGLRSDGRRGFVTVRGSLDAPDVVEEISQVMEGGREAFQRRAQFYGREPRRRHSSNGPQ